MRPTTCTMAKLWPPEAGQWRPFHVVNIALNVVNSQAAGLAGAQGRVLHGDAAALRHRRGLGYRRHANTATACAAAYRSAPRSRSRARPQAPTWATTPRRSCRCCSRCSTCGSAGGSAIRGATASRATAVGRAACCHQAVHRARCSASPPTTASYVYLSDGGHFENLGLYEMIRRRCRCIVISDAGCDPEYGFEDLGNAVRKIAIDLGVYISFSELHEIKRRSKDSSVIKGAYYAIGEIDYKTAPEWSTASARRGRGERLHPLHQARLSRHRKRRHRRLRDRATPRSRTKPPATSSSPSRSSRATARSASRSWTAC